MPKDEDSLRQGVTIFLRAVPLLGRAFLFFFRLHLIRDGLDAPALVAALTIASSAAPLGDPPRGQPLAENATRTSIEMKLRWAGEPAIRRYPHPLPKSRAGPKPRRFQRRAAHGLVPTGDGVR